MKNEPKAAEGGRHFAYFADRIMRDVPKKQRELYFSLMETELSNFSCNPDSRNESWELDDDTLSSLEKNPRALVEILREKCYLDSKPGNAYNTMRGFLSSFQEGHMRSALDGMKDLPVQHKNFERDIYIYRDFPVS